jgi:hypothetical protein
MRQSAIRMLATLAVSVAMIGPVFAQAPPARLLRGTIEKVDGSTIVLKERSGEDLTIVLSDKTNFTAVVKMTLADIKPGSYVGSAALPQPDGTLKAVEVHVFPEWIKPPAGHNANYDLQPGSTMTNATVQQIVESNDGRTLTVKYGDQEKKIVITPTTVLFTYDHGDKAEIKPGVKVQVRAVKGPDGSLSGTGVTIGRDMAPPT